MKWFRRCLLPYISASATPDSAVVRSRLPRDGALRLRAARVSPAQGPECLGLLRAHPRTLNSTCAPHLSPPRAPSCRKEPADAPLYPLSSTFASDSGAGWPASTSTSITGDVPEAMTAQSPDLAVVEHASDSLALRPSLSSGMPLLIVRSHLPPAREYAAYPCRISSLHLCSSGTSH